MKKSDFTGWQEVFRFSLVQGMKENAYICFLVIASMVLLLSMPVSTMITVMNKEAYQSEVTEFTIYDEVGMAIDYSKSLNDDAFRNVKINTTPTRTFDEHVKALEEMSKEMIVRIVYEDAGYFDLTFVKAGNTTLMYEDCKKQANTFIAFLDESRINVVDVSPEQLDILNKTVDTKLKFITQTGEVLEKKQENESISIGEIQVLLFCIMGVTTMIALSGNRIATSIVTEKSTRVMEYLMIHVRPMALITGKILAILFMILVQFVVMGGSFFVSTRLNQVLFGTDIIGGESVSDGETTAEVSEVMKLLFDMSGAKIVIVLAVILGGILFFCILVGLAGASVSRLDELNEGMKIYNMLMVAGAGLGSAVSMMLPGGGVNQFFITICSLLPISAPFVVPIGVLTGKISMSIALISMVILLIVINILFSFTAKVYETMIFHNGEMMKFKDIWQSAKNHKMAEKKGREAV